MNNFKRIAKRIIEGLRKPDPFEVAGIREPSYARPCDAAYRPPGQAPLNHEVCLVGRKKRSQGGATHGFGYTIVWAGKPRDHDGDYCFEGTTPAIVLKAVIERLKSEEATDQRTDRHEIVIDKLQDVLMFLNAHSDLI